MTVVEPKLSGVSPAVERSIDAASRALLALQRPDGHWVFELEADATIPAEYVLLRHYLAEPVNAALLLVFVVSLKVSVDTAVPPAPPSPPPEP